jgi:hypothetical protein
MINDFIFDGRALSDFGYLLVFENSEDVIEVSGMQFNTVKAALSDENRRVSHTYEQNYTSTFLIMKSYCTNAENDLWLSNDDIAELTRWLARKQYKWFRFVDDDEDDDEIWYRAQIQVRKEFAGDKVLGLQLTVNTNAPYGFTREITKTNWGLDTSRVSPIETWLYDHSIQVVSDEEGYIYPDVVVYTESAGTLILRNVTDNNRTTIIKNCVAGETITLTGGDTQQITSTRTHDFTNHFNYIFPRFMTKYENSLNNLHVECAQGESPLVINHPVQVQYKYRGIRKVGLDE